MALWHIAENLGMITNPHSSCLFEREMWRTASVVDQQITFEEFVEKELDFALSPQKGLRVPGRVDVSNNTLEGSFRTIYTSDVLAEGIKTDGDAINYIWELSVYYFLCHIITYTGKKDLSTKKELLRKHILSYLKNLLGNKEYNVKLNSEWIDWQYKQMPYEEFVKKYPNYFGFNAINKGSQEERKEAQEYQYAKATPCCKSEWLDGHLQALKRFIATGECDEEHFVYVMYLLLSEPALGFPRPEKERTGCIHDNEIETVILVSRFAAYIDNKTEMYQSINNFLVDYFFWFLRHEHSARKELDTWNGVSAEIEESCCKQNRCGDLYTIIQSDKDFCAWIQLLKFFDQITLDDAVIFLRCFGHIYAPYGDANDSTFFTENCKEFFSKDANFLKNNPGYVFCMYWMVHYLTLVNFKSVFLEVPQVFSQDNFCSEYGIIPESRPCFKKDSLQKLQMLMFFVLFDLTSKFELGYYEKKFALVPLMKSIENGSWCEKESLLETFRKLEEKGNATTNPLKDFFSDFKNDKESINAAILLVFHMAKFFRNDEQFLIRELDHICELKNKKINIPSHEKYIKLSSKGKASVEDIKNYKNNQQNLHNIDSGFHVSNYMQKIPSYQNLFITRDINVKFFIASDSDITEDDNLYYRNKYKKLWDNKYAYYDRNMATHFSSFSKVADLYNQKNLADLLTCLFDLTTTGPSIIWTVFKEKTFNQIPALPCYKDIMSSCLKKLENFLLSAKKHKIENCFIGDSPIITRKEIENFAEDFWKQHKEDQDFINLKEILNILFCNSYIYKWHAESISSDNKVVKKSYADYNADFWTAYRYEIAVYLIKVCIKLTALKC